MRKKRQFKAGWCYHLVSRIAHRAFFFDEEELLAKINRLYRGTRLDVVLKEWKTLKESSDGTIAGSCDFEAFKQSFVDRMFHPSEFMKTLKHHYTSSYNGRRNHSGTMWDGRFRCRESKRASAEMSAAEIAEALGIKSRPFLTNCYLVPLMAKGLIRQTLSDKPKSRFQRYALA